MGLITCEKHGEEGFISDVSKELSLSISAGKKFSHDKVTYIDVILVDDEDGEVLSKIRYLDDSRLLQVTISLKEIHNPH